MTRIPKLRARIRARILARILALYLVYLNHDFFKKDNRYAFSELPLKIDSEDELILLLVENTAGNSLSSYDR